MADLLSSGPEDRPGPAGPRPRRRWTTPLAAVLVAATAAVLAVRSGAGGEVAEPRADRSGSAVRPDPLPTRGGPLPSPATFSLDGDPGPGPAGLRLLVGGRRPAVLDTGTGRVTAVDGLLERPRDVVRFERGGGLTVARIRNPDLLRARGAVLTGGTVVDLGRLLSLLPMRDGTVLTQDCAGGAGTGPCTLTSRTATGGVRWERTVPRQLDLLRDTPSGLLVRAYQGDEGGVVRLEDPRTGQLRRLVGRTYDVLAATDRHVLFRPADCDSNCRLRLADLAGPGWRELPQSPGRAGAAAISPDGSLVAVGYTGLFSGDRSPAGERDGYVAVAEVAAARLTQVPGLTTGPASTPLPVWAPDGRLVVTVGDNGAGRVAAWRPGDRRLTVLPATLDGVWGEPGLVTVAS